MGGQDEGPTLQGLAQRLEALERENAELRHKVATLEGLGTHRHEAAKPRSSGARRVGEPIPEFEGRVSRRSLIRNVGAAAVAAAAAGTLLNTREAKANHFDPGINVDFVNTHNDTGVAVTAVGLAGVTARALSAGAPGVTGRNDTPAGGVGVRGASPNGTGIHGTGKIGVRGESRAPNLGAVEGHNSSTGAGVVGVGRVGLLAFSHTDGWFGVWGRHTGNGNGVNGDSAQGVGVNGGSQSGYGGQFDGGKAQLRLVPKGSVGRPTAGAHSQGELFLDATGALFVCTASGTPGTWRRVTTTAS